MERSGALPLNQKIQMMEILGEDMRERFDGLDLPRTYKNLLHKRRSRVREGVEALLDWDGVKSQRVVAQSC